MFLFPVFNFIGSIFGYILWAIFWLFQNFGISIFIFTLIFRSLLFPSSLKQQRSMAANASLQAKQREIKEKYANNKAKQNEEMQKLYQREGVSPMSGCLSSLFPMFIMLGIYYSVVRPISNVLHLTTDAINKLNMIPGVYMTQSNIYSEMNVLKLFTSQANVNTFIQHGMPASDVHSIEHMAGGFNFLGLDLLSIPQETGFASAIILIPILCLVTSLGSQILTMKLQKNMQNQQGCMKVMMFLFPLITVYISYIVPGAVGFYWICSTIIGFLQTLIISKFFSPAHMTAQSEARHIALMQEKEAKIQYDYQPVTSSPQSTGKKKK